MNLVNDNKHGPRWFLLKDVLLRLEELKRIVEGRSHENTNIALSLHGEIASSLLKFSSDLSVFKSDIIDSLSSSSLIETVIDELKSKIEFLEVGVVKTLEAVENRNKNDATCEILKEVNQNSLDMKRDEAKILGFIENINQVLTEYKAENNFTDNLTSIANEIKIKLDLIEVGVGKAIEVNESKNIHTVIDLMRKTNQTILENKDNDLVHLNLLQTINRALLDNKGENESAAKITEIVDELKVKYGVMEVGLAKIYELAETNNSSLQNIKSLSNAIDKINNKYDVIAEKIDDIGEAILVIADKLARS
ncbi:MAG: hypothetical protein J0L55_05275 [Caulobacterales bacterium]|nr:hypothetical protein [Caulobacterales bacterium]MCA0373378.1 hypothetical protein [Pseudomonadota bacterium]